MTKEINIYRGRMIDCYAELHDLFSDHDPDFLHTLTDDEAETLEHVLDFESYRFLVVNYETVVVILDGMVSSIYTLKEFGELTKKLLSEK